MSDGSNEWWSCTTGILLVVNIGPLFVLPLVITLLAQS